MDRASQADAPPLPGQPWPAGPSPGTRLAEAICRGVDWFVPANLRGSQPELLMQNRLMAGALVGTLVFGLSFVVQVYRGQGYLGLIPWICMAAFPLLFSNAVLLRVTGSSKLPGSLLCLELTVLIGLMAYHHGAVAVAWNAAVPLLAVFVVGPKLGIACAGLIMCETLGLAFLRQSGHAFPTTTTLEQAWALHTVGSSSLVMFLTGVAVLYHVSRQGALDGMRSTLSALEAANQSLARYSEAAGAASRAKSEFMANMSHEIRTPMTAILGFADVLRSNLIDAENIAAIDTIRRNGEYLLELLNDVLDLSKIEAGKLRVERMACSPRQVLGEVASLMEGRAHAKGLWFETAMAGGVPEYIQSDPTRLRQILMNLVGNAVKFTEEGGIRLGVRLVEGETEGLIEFEVKDTGIGMTSEQLSRLFRPFTQADSSTTRRFGGTGLGLSISKRLTEILGGRITVESKPGLGSTFRVTVSAGPAHRGTEPRPLTSGRGRARPDRPAVPDGGSEARADGSQCRVLLAEDGPDNQRLISYLLRKAGIDVTVVENGSRAVEIALAAREAGRPFDVILMDMQMPVLDGYAATSELRRAGYPGAIIALTAHAMSGDRAKCLEAGCDDYATKPIDRETLLASILRFVKKEAAV
ncbi:MAG: ATP-binding protein [Pirellulales bacterium]